MLRAQALSSTIAMAGLLSQLGCATSAPQRPALETSAPRTSGAAPADWTVPPEAATLRNPLTPSNENLRRGRDLFKRHCTACHGSKGRGDGPVAHLWARLPMDLTHPERQGRLTDGEIYWKISNGHRSGSEVIMPGLEGKVGGQDRWCIVLHLRTLRVTPR